MHTFILSMTVLGACLICLASSEKFDFLKTLTNVGAILNEGAIEAGKEIGDGFDEFGHEVKENFIEAGKKIEQGLDEFGHKVKENAIEAGKEMKEGLDEFGNKVKENAIEAGKEIEQGLDEFGHKVKENAIEAGKKIEQGLDEFGHKMKENAIEAGKEIEEGLDEFGNKVKENVIEAEKVVSEGLKEVGQFIKDWRFNENCSCQNYMCACQVHLEIPQISLNNTGRISATYLVDEIGFEFTFALDGKVILDKKLSVKNPPAICTDLVTANPFANLCFRFHDLDYKENQFTGCTAIEAQLGLVLVERLELGCFVIATSLAQ